MNRGVKTSITVFLFRVFCFLWLVDSYHSNITDVLLKLHISIFHDLFIYDQKRTGIVFLITVDLSLLTQCLQIKYFKAYISEGFNKWKIWTESLTVCLITTACYQASYFHMIY